MEHRSNRSAALRQCARRALAVFGTAVAATVLAAGPYGAAADQPVDVLFERLDLNGDGVITFNEFETVAERRAARIDRAGDGYITREDFLAYQERRALNAARRLFPELDATDRASGGTGGDSRGDSGSDEATRRAVTYADVPRHFRPAHPGADNETELTREAFLDFHRGLAERRMRALFARLDADGDGRISPAERHRYNRERFRQLDADGDGRVTRQEFERAHARWRAERHDSGDE